MTVIILNQMNEILLSTETALSNLNIKSLNEMQQAAMTAVAEHADIVLLSKTGSGKTLAFLLPLIQSIDIHQLNKTQALILAPSRELALQIEAVIKEMRPGCKVTCCYGGHKREIEENNLLQAPTIIIATAGRMADHLRRGNIKTEAIRFLVLDEFDKILELGFQEEMAYILSLLPAVQKKMLTSATSSIELPEFVKMDQAFVLNCIGNDQPEENKLLVKHFYAATNDKIDALANLLCLLKDTSTIVFCNHRDAVERTCQLLADKGILSVFYHGGMEQHDREVALIKFRNGTSNVLITTDLASRGLDVTYLRNVVHYHLPLTLDVYTHRNGRTARMDATGSVYLILAPDETLPTFMADESVELTFPDKLELPAKPNWSTLFIAAGKKDKVNKIDIVGFLSQKGKLKKDDIGLIEVKDFSSFVAIRKSKMGMVIESIKNEKIKNKKVKMAIAK